MNYYKIISDGKVIDANHVYLRYQAKHNILVTCPPEKAQFIQSYDGEQVYRVPWLNPCPSEAGEYPIVEAVEITETEYTELRGKLDRGVEPKEPAPNTSEPAEPDVSENEPPSETVMSVDEMRREILRLQKENKSLDERAEFLESCLMEMSEIVYA